MDQLIITLLAVLAVLALASAIFGFNRRLAHRREAALRAHGYQLIRALQAYSAWIDSQRDLPFTARSLDEMTSPEPLARAREIKRDWFPSLHPQVVRLLYAHNRMIEYLWSHSLMRLTQGSAWCAPEDDPVFRAIRADQEDLIDEMILACRQLTGDAGRGWKGTGSDFSFSGARSQA